MTRQVPAGVTYVLAVGRIGAASQALADLVGPLFRQTAKVGSVDDLFRKDLGFSPLSPADLAGRGVSVEGSAAVFSTGIFPTFAIPVADRAKLEEFIGRAAAGKKVGVVERAGVSVWIVRSEGAPTTSWAFVGDWLFVHVAAPTHEKDELAWLADIVAAGKKGGLAAEADLAWAIAQAGERVDLVGLVRPGAVADALRPIEEAEGLRGGTGCADVEARAAGALRRVALAAALAEGKVDATAFFELSPEAAAAVDAHVAAPPDGAFLSARDEAVVFLSFGVDLDWLGALGRDFGVSGCGVWFEALRDLDLAGARDPFGAVAGGGKLFTSYHLALLGLVPKGDALEVSAIAWLGLSNEAFVREQLDSMMLAPFRKRDQVKGVEVTSIDLSSLGVPGLTEPIRLVLSGGALRVAYGPGALDRLLAGGGASGPRELASFGLRVDKLADLATALRRLMEATGQQPEAGEVVARLFSEYRWLGLRAWREGDGVRVAGGFELR